MNERAIAVCRREGLPVHAYMMSGLEGETLSDLEERLRWLRRARPDSFSLTRLMLHPGTALYRSKGNSFFETSDWTEENVVGYYSTYNLSRVSEKDRRRWMERRYTPYAVRRHRVAVLRLNPPGRLVRLLWRKAGAIGRVVHQARRGGRGI